MMMCYGLFVFSLKTIPFQQMTETKEWRYPGNSRVNKRSAFQFTGNGNEVITLTGTLYPELTGGKSNLLLLEKMSDLGTAWPLIEGTGALLGFFVMTNLNKTKNELLNNGAARKIDFTISLKKVDPPENIPFSEIIGLL